MCRLKGIGFNVWNFHFYVPCIIHVFHVYFQISLNGSIWSTVSVTLERYVSVVHPRHWSVSTPGTGRFVLLKVQLKGAKSVLCQIRVNLAQTASDRFRRLSVLNWINWCTMVSQYYQKYCQRVYKPKILPKILSKGTKSVLCQFSPDRHWSVATCNLYIKVSYVWSNIKTKDLIYDC